MARAAAGRSGMRPTVARRSPPAQVTIRYDERKLCYDARTRSAPSRWRCACCARSLRAGRSRAAALRSPSRPPPSPSSSRARARGRRRAARPRTAAASASTEAGRRLVRAHRGDPRRAGGRGAPSCRPPRLMSMDGPRRGVPERRAGAARPGDRRRCSSARISTCGCAPRSSEPEASLPALRLGEVDLGSCRTRTRATRRRPDAAAASASTSWRTRSASCSHRPRRRRATRSSSPTWPTSAGSPRRRARACRAHARGRLPRRRASPPTSHSTRTTSASSPRSSRQGSGSRWCLEPRPRCVRSEGVVVRPVADVPVTRRIYAAARRGGLERPALAMVDARCSARAASPK